MPEISPQIAESKPTYRSRVTNGSELLPGVDGRSVWARRLRDVIAAIIGDLGGSDMISEAQRSLVRRAATLTVELERMERNFALGYAKAEDVDLYGRTCNTLKRLLMAVGLKRRARPVGGLPRLLGDD